MNQFRIIIQIALTPNSRFSACMTRIRASGVLDVRLRGLSSLGLLSGWPVMKAGLQPANGWVAGDTPSPSSGVVSDDASEVPKRSTGTLRRRRVRMPWPGNRQFRILSIDGGGIRGVFPAAFLAGLENRYLGGTSVAKYFDLIAGTSTGGIIALGLADGLRASELRDIYIQRGCEIFPPVRSGILGIVERQWRNFFQLFRYRYDREALTRVLEETFGDRKLGEASSRLCIPSFEGRYGEVYIFKTPHHPDFRKDGRERMTKVAAATGAAPTYFQPLRDGGYTFVDGGVWANNPIMIALVDALTCFAVPRECISILSIGCGDESYVVGRPKVLRGGLFAWRDIIHAAMRLQSQNALGQAGLLIGADRVVRVVAPELNHQINLDDWSRASQELPEAASTALIEKGNTVAAMFLSELAVPYKSVVGVASRNV